MSLLNRAVFGRDDRPDLEKKDYTGKRLALFFDVFKVRWMQMIQLNAQLILTLLPLIIWGILTLLAVSAYMSTNQVTAAEMNIFDLSNEHVQHIYTMTFQYLLINIPLMALAGPPIAACTWVLQRWGRDEHAEAWGDFKDQILQNWKQPMLLMFIDGVLLLLAYMGINFYTAMAAEQGSVIAYFAVYCIYIFMLLLLAANLYAFPIMTAYKVKFGKMVRNAFMLAIARLPWTIMLLLIIGATLIWLLTSLAIVTALIYLVIGFTLVGLIIVSCVEGAFDKYVLPSSTTIEKV